MRVLCTATASPSYRRTLLPLVELLCAAGHEVLTACPPTIADELAGHGLRLAPVLTDPFGRFWRPYPDGVVPGGPVAGAVGLGDAAWRSGEVFAGEHVARGALGLRPIASAFEPDLVLRDGAEVAGYLIAEAFELPQVALPSGGIRLVDPVDLAARLSRLRGAVGLGPLPERPVPGPRSRPDVPQGRGAVLEHLPRRYAPVSVPCTSVLRYRRPGAPAGGAGAAGVPDVLRDAGPKPVVVASLGTALCRMAPPTVPDGAERPAGPGAAAEPGSPRDRAELRAAVRTALSDVDCVVVETGAVAGVERAGVERGGGGPGPAEPRVRVLPVEMLRHADVFVTHGGYSGICAAIGAGVPVVALPSFGDQPRNAELMAELGLGVVVRDRRPDSIAAACRAVLADPGYARRARQARRAAAELPPLADAVHDLERLAARPRLACLT